jgi:RNA polymerase-binding transcription factor DksA
MATKKKAAPKAASKKPSTPKKSAAPSKKPVKPVAKKPAPAASGKKPAKPVAKAVSAAKSVAKKVHAVVKPSSKSEKHNEKPVSAKSTPQVQKKAETKAPEQHKVLPKKPEVPQPIVQQKQVTPPPPFKQVAKKPEPPQRPAKLVMPEIKTKTVRKYEPDFTKSVLDTPMQDNSGPSQRYSDVDLAEFRELINKKLEAAKKELNYLQGLITRKDEMGGDESDNRYMTMEDGSISMEREQLSQMASRQITFIDHLEKAIMRIENKTYGICRVTGKLIDKARLRAVPHATLSIEAKQTMNK